VGTIREALISVEELGVYQAAWEAGALSVRARPLIRVPNDVGADAAIALVEGLGVHSGFGDDWLRLWGLKLVLDGGVEGGATDEPYANDPANHGHLNWDPEAMLQVCLAAARRGWRIGTHAVGDRAVRVVLDVYERVTTELGGLAPATLVVEHALLADPPSGRGRSVWGWVSPSSMPCCGTWPARCSPPGDRSGPPGSTRSTSGWTPGPSWPRGPTSCGRSTR
jgi:predicted amidohydrolase YtcJ